MLTLLETTGSVVAAGAGVGLGYLSSRLRKPYWAIGYCVPLMLFVAIAMARRVSVLESTPPLSWIMGGRLEFAIQGTAAATLFATLLPKVAKPGLKMLVTAFALLCVVGLSILPFAAPLLVRGRLAALNTTIDKDGVCIQGTGFTCGPAAAVTALKHLGIDGDEGAIAILSHTSSKYGTRPKCLRSALLRLYGREGLSCERAFIRFVPELNGRIPFVAVVKFSFMVDHYVTVLEATDNRVVIGDPIAGKRVMTHDEFASIWRFRGLLLSREAPPVQP